MDQRIEPQTMTVATVEPGEAAPATTPAAKGQVSADRSSFSSLLGDVTWLMTRSQGHKHLFLADIEWLVLPALTARQFRLIVNDDGKPHAFVSWAFLNEEAEARMLAGQPRLRPGDWRSGDRVWLVDLVAPFGGADAIARLIKTQVFSDRILKALRPRPDGKGLEGVEVMAAKPTVEPVPATIQ